MGRKVTISDVAKHAGVSTATVSRVLNGVGAVDGELRARVETSVAELRYVRNYAGRALRRQRSEMVSVVVPDIKNAFFTELTYSLESVMSSRGIQLVVGNSDESSTRETDYVQSALEKQFSGVVLAAASDDSTAPAMLREAGMPLVLVDRMVSDFAGASVTIDNAVAGQLAAHHLAEAGFRRPAVLSSFKDISTTHQRARAFVETALSLGMEVPAEVVISADTREEGAEAAMWGLVGTEHDFDCVFACNGPLTAAAYRVLHSAGWIQNQRIGLLGVDNEMWTDLVTPSVTVIRQPVEEMGRVAAHLLMQQVDREATNSDSVVLLPQLIVRASTRRS